MSKFGDLRDLKNRSAEPAAPVTPANPPAGATHSPAPPKETGPGSRGGKRDNDKYTQTTTYLPVDTLHKVKRRLLDERLPGGKGRDLSGVVAELLKMWLDHPNW